MDELERMKERVREKEKENAQLREENDELKKKMKEMEVRMNEEIKKSELRMEEKMAQMIRGMMGVEGAVAGDRVTSTPVAETSGVNEVKGVSYEVKSDMNVPNERMKSEYKKMEGKSEMKRTEIKRMK